MRGGKGREVRGGDVNFLFGSKKRRGGDNLLVDNYTITFIILFYNIPFYYSTKNLHHAMLNKYN